MDGKTRFADDATLAYIAELEDALIAALPYVETAESDSGYKPGAVAKVARQIRAAIAKATAA